MGVITMPDVRLIDANALLSAIDEEIEYSVEYAETNFQLINKVLKIARKDIECAPTIDAKSVKHGKWEWEPGYVGTTAKCSACGLSPMGFYSLPINQIGRLPEYPFCPKCGAKMDGGDADETV